jgi:hypothetical protein
MGRAEVEVEEVQEVEEEEEMGGRRSDRGQSRRSA